MPKQKRFGHTVAAIIAVRDGGIGSQLDALGIPCYVADVIFALKRSRESHGASQSGAPGAKAF